jgi:hydroxymethylglutaryl-CoA reductase
MLGLEQWGFLVRIRSELPPGAGLGTSAALAIAVLRALAAGSGRRLEGDVEFALGQRLESIFHSCPSGVDPAAAVVGSCFRFVRGQPPSVTRVRTRRPLPIVLALGGGSRATTATADYLRACWHGDRVRYERLFDEVGAVVEEGVRAAELGDLGRLGEAFDRNQALLHALGVSVREDEGLVSVVKAAGALGAKLSGGTANGVLALATEPHRLAATLRARGLRTVIVQTGA